MYDAAKLHRDELQDKEPKKKAHELDGKQADASVAADMPSLDGASSSLAPGLGAKADAAADPAAMQAQQQELARLQSLPAGDPELESYKKPEAMAAQVPEGPGATGDAAGASEAMSPKQEQQSAGEIGPPAESVDAAMPDVGAALEKVDVASTVSGASEAAGGAADAAAAASKQVNTPTEVAPRPVSAPTGAEVAAESTTPLDMSAPAEAKMDAPAPASVKAEAPALASQSAPRQRGRPKRRHGVRGGIRSGASARGRSQ